MQAGAYRAGEYYSIHLYLPRPLLVSLRSFFPAFVLCFFSFARVTFFPCSSIASTSLPPSLSVVRVQVEFAVAVVKEEREGETDTPY